MSWADTRAGGRHHGPFGLFRRITGLSWPDLPAPARMRRVALVAPGDALRDVLVRVADAAAVELGPPAGETAAADGARPRTARQRAGCAVPGIPPPAAALSAARPDLDALERAGRYDLLAGEAQLEAYAAGAVRRSGACALAGWMPADRVDALAARLAEAGGAVVPLPYPRGAEPPTLLAGPPAKRALSPLVQTYGTVPYADVDPTWLAWASYVLMFGMMFGDVGEGLVLVAAAVALRAGWPRWARRFRQAWLFVAGAGVAATGFGVLYGEFFGPTGVVPVVWLDPLDRPVTLLVAAAGVGALLLAGAYALGTVNRWREGGWAAALYAPVGRRRDGALPRGRPDRRRVVSPPGPDARGRARWSPWPGWRWPRPVSSPGPEAARPAGRRPWSSSSTWSSASAPTWSRSPGWPPSA